MPAPTRRHFLAGAAGLAFPTLARAADEPPETGPADPRLAGLDEMMRAMVTTHGVPGVALAVARKGALVYARGFGYADKTTKRPVRPNSTFRVASVSKPITAALVLKLVDRKKLAIDEPVFPHLKLDPPPGGGTPDPRWKTVTLRQCLQHTGGWDRDKSFDPIAVPRQVAKALGVETPVPPEAVIRYMLDVPFDFDAGTRYAYSNLGYLVLGRVAEAVTGKDYAAAVHDEVFAPLGVRRPRLARALPENRPADEVAYYQGRGRTGKCLYPPRRGEVVPLPDGAENVEAFAAHGGWVASAPDLARFASAFDDPTRCPILSAAGVKLFGERPAGAGAGQDTKLARTYYGCGWDVVRHGPRQVTLWHTGYIAGTTALLVRRWDNVSWAVLFNTDRTAGRKDPVGVVDPLVHAAVDAVAEWPDRDLFPEMLKS